MSFGLPSPFGRGDIAGGVRGRAAAALLPATAYTFTPGNTYQTLDGIGAELQCDSIEGDGGGIQEANTKGLPFGLSSGERSRFASEVMSVDGAPITYTRLALGLYFRGVSADGKSFTRERIPGSNATIKAMMDASGSKFAVGHWSPAPYWKLNGGFNGLTESVPDRDGNPSAWNTYLRSGLQGGSLNCPDKVADPTGYAAWQDEFAASVLATLEYIHQNMGCVALYFPQNEPSISTSYPSCVWTGTQTYDHLTRMRALIDASSILATYGGQPNTVKWYLDAQNGQVGIGAGTARGDAALMATNYGWAWHRISQMAEDRNWAHNNVSALTSNLSGYPGRAFCEEYEFFDPYVDPVNVKYIAPPARFANIVSNAFRFFVEAAARIHFWIHVGKNSDGPVFERNGRALTTWRPTGVAAPSDYPDLAEGAFTLIKPNAHSNLAMVKHIKAGSVRVSLAPPAYDADIAYLALRRPDERHCIALVNSGATARRITIDTAGLSWAGWRYDVDTWEAALGTQTGIIDVTIPAYAAVFFVQTPTAPAAMAAPSLVAGNAQIAVTRAAAPSNGGSAITGYELRHSADQVNWTVVSMTTNPQTISGLANDAARYVQTRAKNAIGDGAWSPSASATPTATISDFTADFNAATVGADLSTVTGFTGKSGSSSITISSGHALNSNDATTNGTGYMMPDTGSQAQKILATVKGVSGGVGPLLCVRYTDPSNWVGVRWSSSAYELVKRVAGTATVLATTSGVTPTINDLVRLEVDASNNARVLINGTQRIAPTAIAAAGLTSTHPGLVSRTLAKTPWIDDVTSGPN